MTSLGSTKFFVSLFQCISKLVDAKAQSLSIIIKLHSRRHSPCCQMKIHREKARLELRVLSTGVNFFEKILAFPIGISFTPLRPLGSGSPPTILVQVFRQMLFKQLLHRPCHLQRNERLNCLTLYSMQWIGLWNNCAKSCCYCGFSLASDSGLLCLSRGGLLSWGLGHLWGWSCCSLQWPVSHPIHYFISDHFLLCPQRSDHNLCNLIRDFLYVISIFLDLNSVVLEGTAHPFIGVSLSIIHIIPVLSFSKPKNMFLLFSKPSNSPHIVRSRRHLALKRSR